MTEQLTGRAAKLASQVTGVASPALAGGETVLIAVRVNLTSTVAATAAGAIGGAAGTLAGAAAHEAGCAQAAEAGFPSDPQQALGLTERALVITSRGGLSGKPKQLRQVVPLTDLESVRHEPGRLSR